MRERPVRTITVGTAETRATDGYLMPDHCYVPVECRDIELTQNPAPVADYPVSTGEAADPLIKARPY